MSKSLHEELDDIWLKALKESPCKCGNDDKWAQDIKGPIKKQNARQLKED